MNDLFSKELKINSLQDLEEALNIITTNESEYYRLNIQNLEPISFRLKSLAK